MRRQRFSETSGIEEGPDKVVDKDLGGEEQEVGGEEGVALRGLEPSHRPKAYVY
jgi:hypothetical protein